MTLKELRETLLTTRAAWVQVRQIAHQQIPELLEEADMQVEALETTLELLGDYMRDNTGIRHV